MAGRFPLLTLALALAASACGKPSAPTLVAAPGASSPLAAGRHMAHLPATIADWSRGAMPFDGLGSARRAITTSSDEAQQYFDQGLRLMWAFNHDEATRSFAKAAALDPRCASCYWGVALTVGPNYNLPFLSGERAKVAFEALHLAEQYASHASPVEQALIAALAKRYPNDQPLQPAAAVPVLSEYARAMRAVATRFGADLDVQTLYAESLMNVNAWKLWAPDGRPAPGTEEIIATLESVLDRDPRHPGANHYYIHAVEASPHPEKGVAAAARLPGLAPGAGHLVHMPAHILQRIGRYEDAAEANRRAAAADQAYGEHTQPPDYYPVMYTAHNYQFLAYSTAMEGRKAETLAAADSSRTAVSDEMLLDMPGTDWYVTESYAARLRFGLWEEMLSLPAPDQRLAGLTGGFLYGRAVAFAAIGRIDEARATLVELRQLATVTPADAAAGQNTVRDVLSIAIPVVEARIAAAERRTADALAKLREAVAAEDQLGYDEPKNWFFPVRHLLGAALMQAGEASEAERVYRDDLRQCPGNGWSLYGLREALRAQHRSDEAARVGKAFEAAWTHADVHLTASAF
jgi:tetratricopeptide (TPR) repeat protein